MSVFAKIDILAKRINELKIIKEKQGASAKYSDLEVDIY